MKNNLTDTLMQIVGVGRYRGCLVWKVKDGWNVFGRIAKSKEEVDKIIDEATKSLSKTIQQ